MEDDKAMDIITKAFNDGSEVQVWKKEMVIANRQVSIIGLYTFSSMPNDMTAITKVIIRGNDTEIVIYRGRIRLDKATVNARELHNAAVKELNEKKNQSIF